MLAPNAGPVRFGPVNKRAVKALRPFYVCGKLQELGAIVLLDLPTAAEIVTAGKAVFYVEPPKVEPPKSTKAAEAPAKK